MNYKLKNKNCIITGASQGLGKAIAILLAEEGCNLILVSRRPKPLKAVEKIINTKYKKKIAYSLPYDVTKKDAPKKIISFCKKKFGIPGVLINSAGGSRPTTWNATDTQWDEGMTLNFTALRKLTTEIIPLMQKKKMGKSDQYNRICRAKRGQYCKRSKICRSRLGKRFVQSSCERWNHSKFNFTWKVEN